MNLTEFLTKYSVTVSYNEFTLKVSNAMFMFLVILLISIYLIGRYFSYRFKKLIEDRKKPTWCQACDKNMRYAYTEKYKVPYYGNVLHRPIMQCPKCGITRYM